MNRQERFVEFIVNRHATYEARTRGENPPWSDDPILRRHKFCNVFRELDRVTRWLTTNWREPHRKDSHLWFALTVFRRCINLPATAKQIGYPVPWEPGHFLSLIARRKAEGKRLFNSHAYKVMVSQQGGDLAELQVNLILNPLWGDRNRFRPRCEDTLASFHTRLAAVPYMGNFYSAQVVADLKYAGRLRRASDWWDFAASGPGSRRGLNRVLGRPTNAPWKEDEWFTELHLLRKAVARPLAKAGLPRMHAQDLQGCLCEFDKFERLRLGEGIGRRFIPSSKPLPTVKTDWAGPRFPANLPEFRSILRFPREIAIE